MALEGGDTGVEEVSEIVPPFKSSRAIFEAGSILILITVACPAQDDLEQPFDTGDCTICTLGYLRLVLICSLL